MAEDKRIGTISVITDTETGQEKIGDVQGGFDEIQLKEHIKNYGIGGLLETITWMNFQVWQMHREINAEKDKEQIANSTN